MAEQYVELPAGGDPATEYTITISAVEIPAEQVEAELHQQAVEAFKVALADLPDACCQEIYEWLHKLGHRIYRE